jgi:tight adherence protein B
LLSNPLVLVGLLVGVGVLIAGAVMAMRERTADVSERLDRYADVSGGKAAADTAAQAPRSSPVADRLNEAITKRGLFGGLSTQLAQADLKMTPAEWLAVQVMLVIGAGLIGFIVNGGQLLFVAIYCVIGGVAPNFYLGFRRGQRRTKFNNQLGDVLNLWVNALRSGYSVLQALDAMARELPPPASVEFARVVQEVRLGITMEVAFGNLLRRVPSDDLDLVITAVNVQREVGGNLAEILEVISHTIRERVRIKGEIEVLTAQQMYGGYVISLLPIILMLILYAINPNYVGLLLTEVPCGWLMLGCGMTMIVAGFIAIQRIVRIEV